MRCERGGISVVKALPAQAMFRGTALSKPLDVIYCTLRQQVKQFYVAEVLAETTGSIFEALYSKFYKCERLPGPS